jgi:hypothetical protein
MSLTAMEEAFKKSGLVSQAKIDENERLRQTQEENKKKSEKTAREFEARQDRREYERVNARYLPIQRLWDGERSHKFLVHLLYSFTPLEAAHYAWFDSEFREQKNCCICHTTLISKEFMFDHLNDVSEQALDQLRRSLRGEPVFPRQEFVQRFGNVVMGLVSEKSSSAFCSDCHTLLYEWIQNELARGNRAVRNIINQRMLEEVLTTEQMVKFNEIRQIRDSQLLHEFLATLEPKARMAVNLATARY